MRLMVFSCANKIASGLHFCITERPVIRGENTLELAILYSI